MVWCIFRFIFMFILPHLFLKFGLSFLLNMQTMKITMREKREKKQKHHIQYGKGTFIYEKKSAKKSKIHIPHLFLYLQTFSLSSPYSWISLIDILYFLLSNFGVFLENFDNEINLETYSFSFCWCTQYLLFS